MKRDGTEMSSWQSFMWDYRDPEQYIEKLKHGMPPLIISVAITGGVAGKEENPALPETPEEQADSTYEACKAGASVVHIHARDPNQGYAGMSVNTDDFRRVNKLVRERCPDIIIGNTAGGSMLISREEARVSLDAGPEMASLNCGPLLFRGKLRKRLPPLTGRDEDISIESKITAVTWAETELQASEMKRGGIKAELEVYHPQMLNVVRNLINKGLVEKPYWFSLIFGDPIATPPTPLNLVTMALGLPTDSIFQFIGVAYMQLSVITMGMLMGGHVRVGMEDNLFYRKGELLKSNADAVRRVVQLAEVLERPVATPKQAREILGLSSTPSRYD